MSQSFDQKTKKYPSINHSKLTAYHHRFGAQSKMVASVTCPPVIKMVLLVLAMAIVNSSNCQSLVIPSRSIQAKSSWSKPVEKQSDQNRLVEHSSIDPNNHRSMATNNRIKSIEPVPNKSSTNMRPPTTAIDSQSIARPGSALTKRSVGEESSNAYAGHSIMRFGRAPHNIMHFGKRSEEDNEDQIRSADGSSHHDNKVSSVRYVLVPIAHYGDGPLPSTFSSSSMPWIRKKSLENLETTRGVFMHFG